MPKLFQITIEANINSVGRIAEQIGLTAIKHGWESYITYSRSFRKSKSNLIKIGSKFDIYRHVIMTRLFDRHCLHSTKATKRLIKQIEEINPDIIQLHHIHGYFLDMKLLFNYLAKAGKPVVWIFHDCWAFTGHCSHFDRIGHKCNRWLTECHNCPFKRAYPSSILFDRSRKNFILKKKLFNSVPNLTIVSVSQWLNSIVGDSFLKGNKLECIPNGIDINQFNIRNEKEDSLIKYGINPKRRYIVGVASTWTISKGFNDFIKLRDILSPEIQVVMVGLSPKQIKTLPSGIIGIRKTDNADDLATLYSKAEVFVNPTYSDTFPTVNIEAQACGTPVVTYDTGGSPEIIENNVTGLVVPRGNVAAMAEAINKIMQEWNLQICAQACRNRVVEHYDRETNFNKYIDLYNRLLNNSDKK